MAGTIKINDINCITSRINAFNNDIFVTFNYTSVLKKIYQIDEKNIIHIHGSLH